MHYQKTQLRRDICNNPHIYQDILATAETNMGPSIKTPDRYNATYGSADFNRAVVRACISNSQIAGCTCASKEIASSHALRRSPGAEWIRNVASKTVESDVYECFAKTVSEQFDSFQEMGLVKKNQVFNVAIDMHLIARYDEKYGSELIRSKAKNGTDVFERYITIQCIVNGRRLILGVLHMSALEDKADFVRKIINCAQNTRVNIGIVMLDREFFTSKVIYTLHEMGMTYLIPCKNTDVTIDAIAAYATGDRQRISECVITGSEGKAVPYTIIITQRKKKRKKNVDLLPHEKYIGFATNVPDIDVKQYKKRWGIETGYRMIQDTRARTHSKNYAARLLYFAYSAVMFNVWVMANAVLAYITMIHQEDPLITQQHLKHMLLFYVLDDKIVPEPPPQVL